MTETERAIAIIEARIPLYTDIGQINALRECISSIRSASPPAVPGEVVSENAKLVELIKTRFLGVHPDDLDCYLEYDDWTRIIAALSVPLPEIEVGDKGDGWQTIDTAPKDGRRILIKTVTFGWSSDICQNVATGDKWVEARWGKDLSGNEKWLEWCGDDKTHTTDSLTPLAWAPVPALSVPLPEIEGEVVSADEIKLLIPLLKAKIADDLSRHFNGKLWGHEIVDMSAMKRLLDRLDAAPSASIEGETP